MKNKLSLLFLVLAFLSCKKEVVVKPKNLIEKDKMINLMYDFALLEAIKYQSYSSLAKHKIDPATYLYKKYQIDSLQFVKSNLYYASDYELYKEMFDEVTKRITDRKTELDSVVKAEKENKLLKKRAALKNKIEANLSK